jgi:hypothetical protein
MVAPQLFKDPSQQDTWLVSLQDDASFHQAALSRQLWGLQRRPATAKAEMLMSKEVQLAAAITPGGFALPQNLNLMRSDPGNSARSVGLAIVLAHTDDTVA